MLCFILFFVIVASFSMAHFSEGLARFLDMCMVRFVRGWGVVVYS